VRYPHYLECIDAVLSLIVVAICVAFYIKLF